MPPAAGRHDDYDRNDHAPPRRIGYAVTRRATATAMTRLLSRGFTVSAHGSATDFLAGSAVCRLHHPRRAPADINGPTCRLIRSATTSCRSSPDRPRRCDSGRFSTALPLSLSRSSRTRCSRPCRGPWPRTRSTASKERCAMRAIFYERLTPRERGFAHLISGQLENAGRRRPQYLGADDQTAPRAHLQEAGGGLNRQADASGRGAADRPAGPQS